MLKISFYIICLFITNNLFANQGYQKFCEQEEEQPVCVKYKEHNCEECFLKEKTFLNSCEAKQLIEDEEYPQIMKEDVISITNDICINKN